MSDFKRERRYEVKKIGKPDWNKSCVVIEEDWPEYDIVWQMLQDRIEGKPNILDRQSAMIAELQARIEAADKQEPFSVLRCDSLSLEPTPLFTRPPIRSERELELLAVIDDANGDYDNISAELSRVHLIANEKVDALLEIIKQKDAALRIAQNPSQFAFDDAKKIAKALALTPESALKEHYVAEKSENGLEWEFANTLHDLPVGTKLYALKP